MGTPDGLYYRHCQTSGANCALIADLPNYHRWLPPSGLYGKTTQVSDTPLTLGTMYVDGKQATLHGRVTEFRPPFALAFHQEARLLLSRLTINIRYRLEPLGAHTRVYRTTTPRLSGVSRLCDRCSCAPYATRISARWR